MDSSQALSVFPPRSHLRHGWWLVPLAMLAGTVALADGRSLTAALFYSALLMAGLVAAVLLSISLGQGPRVCGYIVFAWVTRMVLMGMLKAYSYSNDLKGFYPFDGDARDYHNWATAAAMTENWLESLIGMPGYLVIVTGIYRWTGPDINIPELLNLGLSLLAVPLIYQLALRIHGERSAGLAALLWGIMPAGVMWSISLMKDVWIAVGILLAAFGVIATLRTRLRPVELVAGILGLMLIGLVRPPFMLIPALALGILIIFGQAAPGKTGLYALVAVAIIAFVTARGVDLYGSLLPELARAASDEGVEGLGEIALKGNTGVAFLVGVPSAVRWILQIPFSIFAPFPWQWGTMGSGIARISALEMALWYVVYFQIWRARRAIWSTPEGKTLLIMAAIAFIAVSFSLPNIGSIYRYRWPALVLLLPAMPPIAEWGRRVPARRGSTSIENAVR